MKNQSSTSSPANYGSNNERLKKAMLQRNKPAQQQPAGHSTNSLVLNHHNQSLDYHNHHMSVSNFTTYSSSSSSSSFSSSEFTTDSMSSCGSYNLHGKFTPSLEVGSPLSSQFSSSQQTLNSNKYNMQLEPVSNSHSTMSPMSYDYTTSSTGSGNMTNNSSKFGSHVANSMLSLSSVDSPEQNRSTTTKRLFESSLQTDVPDLDAPVFIVPTKCSRVEEEPSMTALPLPSAIDDLTGNLTQVSLQSSLHSLDINEYYTTFSSNNHTNLSMNALKSQSSLLRLQKIADNTHESRISIPSTQYNIRRNSVSSISSELSSSQNSFLNNPSLDLDSVIRSALVETSHTVQIKKQLATSAEYTSMPITSTTLNAGSNEYRNEFSLPLASSNIVTQMDDSDYQQQEKQQKKGISRIGNSVMKLARKMKN